MATDDATITGTFDDKTFQFYIDGVATHRQMDKLLDKVDALLKKFKAQDLEENRAEKERKKERELIDATNTLRDKESDALEKRIDVENVLNRVLSLQSSGLRGMLQPLDRTAMGLSLMSAGLYGVIGGFKNLLDYSVHVGAALQMGIGGGVMDFAVSAKTAGLNLTDFTKALQESGGGFAQLGSNATEGSRQFANLVREVRTATGAIGNLGMTNEQLAVFTAQQLKVAVGQGMRGRRAQEFVIQNTREFGKELDELASKTGKSVVELAQAAMKVGMNPVIASFVRDAGSMGGKVSTAAQKAVASFSAIFGERGAKIAEDAIQSAMSGLPFIVTKSGQDLFTIASGVATEMERQAQKTARGEEITEADRERLRQIVLAETKARGHELRQLASLPGPLQESAKQLLELSKDAQYYNTEEGKRDRKKAEASKKFMEESNKLKATLQELAIPFLQLLNGIDWAGIFSVFSALLKGVQIVLTPLAAVGKFLGDTGLGGLLAALITLGTVVGGTILVFKNLKYALEIFGGLGKGLGGLFGKKAGDRVTDGITGKKERGSILDIFGGKSQDVSIVGGVGTNPARPLFVYIVGGNKGRRGTGPAAPGGPLGGPGGPLDDVLGDGAERRGGAGYRKGAKERLRELRKEGLSPAEARRKYEMEQRGAAAGGQVRDFFKNNKLALLSGAAIITGGFASMYAEKALAEDPESTSGKIASVIAPVLEYGGALAGTFDLINRFAPEFANSIKSWTGMIFNSTAELAKKFIPGLSTVATKFTEFGSKITSAVPTVAQLGAGLKAALPALTKFGTGLMTVAAPFIAGFAIDAIAGQIIGKVSDEERVKLNKQDDKNWEKMSLWEKTQSSLARGIEHLGRAFFLGNLADKAAKTRIEKESKYLEEKSPEGKRKKQAEETALASDRKLLKQLADEGSIKEDFFKKGPVFGVKSLEELNGADAKKNTSTVKPDGTRTERKEFSFSEAELAKTSQIATPATDAEKSKRLDVYESLSKSGWQKSSATLPEFEKTATGVQSAQVAAIDQEKSKAAQDKQSSSKMVELLTDLKSINEAALGVQAKGVSVADSSNKFLRDQKVLGWTGPAA